MYKLLKDKLASPLVEEGILLCLTIVTLSIVLSLIVGLLGGAGKALGGANEAINSFFQSTLRSLDDLLKQLNQLFTGEN